MNSLGCVDMVWTRRQIPSPRNRHRRGGQSEVGFHDIRVKTSKNVQNRVVRMSKNHTNVDLSAGALCRHKKSSRIHFRWLPIDLGVTVEQNGVLRMSDTALKWPKCTQILQNRLKWWNCGTYRRFRGVQINPNYFKTSYMTATNISARVNPYRK